MEQKYYFYRNTAWWYTRADDIEQYLIDIKNGKASMFYEPVYMTREQFKKWLDEIFWYQKD